jgi:hypothetical protein
MINRSKIPTLFDLLPSTLRRFRPDFGCCATRKKLKHTIQRSLKYFMLAVRAK